MTRKTIPDAADRFLILRNHIFYYRRRIPKEILAFDQRSKIICESLKTSNIFEARTKRDMLESGDNEYWSSLMLGQRENSVRSRYEQARTRARALGLSYKPAAELATGPIEELTARLDRVLAFTKEPYAFETIPRAVTETALGMLKEPTVSLKEMEKTFFDEIAPPQIMNKSEAQKRHWISERQYTFDLMRKVIGKKAIGEIEREDALKFYRYLMAKVSPKDGEPSLSASYGKKQIGRVRRLYREYYNHIGEMDRPNPFDGLTFKETANKPRPAFAISWIKDKILQPGALDGLNAEAKAIVLTLIDTGARLGEIANLTKSNIHLDTPVPYIEIAPRLEQGNRREIKTRSSIRKVPLIGISLAVMMKFPNGFPRYQDKSSALSSAINKYFRKNGLFAIKGQTLYSFRHSFEDRMKESGIDHELRRRLMGHSIDRPEYGTGGSMEWQQRELRKIEIPFDPAIL